MIIFKFIINTLQKGRDIPRLICALTLISSVLLSSCDDNDVGSYFTFTDEMIGEFLMNDPDNYSEFVKVLEATNVIGLLNAYGEYTCFAPNNDAMKAYYAEKGKTLEEFDLEDLKAFAYDHIIMGTMLMESDFKEGILDKKSMNDRFISVTYANYAIDRLVYVNKNSPILSLDNELHNGIVHGIGQPLMPSNLLIVGRIAENEDFSLFSEAITATDFEYHLKDIEDESYDPDDFANIDLSKLPWTGKEGEAIEIPKSRKYGFTVFVVSNDTYAKHNIFTLDDLRKKAAELYTSESDDETNAGNSLNKYIAYHVLDRQLRRGALVEQWVNIHHVKVSENYQFEYVEPMLKNTLIEFKCNYQGQNTVINQYAEGLEIKIGNVYDIDALNGVYHEIDGLMYYGRDVHGMMMSKRLRINCSSFFKELINNNYRGVEQIHRVMPPGFCEKLEFPETTKPMYLGPDSRFCDFQGDEFILNGAYEFTITTPPIPEGTYEVRFGYQPTNLRGVAQLYWDSIPCGIPLNLTIDAANDKIGYEKPGTDKLDPQGLENDKMMRNRGYMKGGESYRNENTTWYNGNTSARDCVKCLRRVLGIYKFDDMKSHKFTVKGLKDGQFMLDYLEFVPVEIIETEDTF